jgi:MFS family permease
MSDPSPGGAAAPEPAAAPLPPARAAVALVAGLIATFILSQFFRTAIAVIAPGFMAETGISAANLGLLTGAYFLSAAAMQLPVGILFDRYGPRLVVPSLMCLAVMGALTFGLAHDPELLLLGQVLIAAGCSGIFIGGLILFGRWFAPHRFATVSAAAFAVSGLGTLASGTPFAAAVQWIGWRGGYLVMAGVTAALAIFIVAVVRDAPPGHPWTRRERESLRETLSGLRRIYAQRQIYGLFAMSFVSYGSIMAVRGLWAGPYLTGIYGLGTIMLGNFLVILSLASIAGLTLYGPLDRVFNTRKRLVMTGICLNAAALLTLSALSQPPLALAMALLAGGAMAGAVHVQILAHGRAFFGEEMSGRVLTALNFCTFLGVGLLQIASGTVIEALTPAGASVPVEAYRGAFAMLGGVLLLALAIYSRTSDKPPKQSGPLGAD